MLPAAPGLPIGLLCEQQRKVNEFCALSQLVYTNCDHHILLIMTGNAHIESCHKLLLTLVREHVLYIINTDCSEKMVVA